MIFFSSRLLWQLAGSSMALVLFVLLVGAHASAQPLLPPAQLPRPTKNLVSNGDFEEPGLPRVEEGRWGIDEAAQVSGRFSWHARGSSSADVRHDVELALEVGETYTMSAWIKCRGLTARGATATDIGAGLMMVDLGWHWQTGIGPETPTSDWKRYAITFQAPPSHFYEDQSFRIVFYLPKGAKGEIWVDDLQVERADSVTKFTPNAVPDFQRAVSIINNAHTRCTAVSWTLGRLSPKQGIRDLTDRVQQIRAELETAAAGARQFESLPPAQWRRTVQAVERCRADLADLGWCAWWTNPWQRYGPHQAPPSLAEPQEARLTLAINDYAPLALMLTNLSEASLDVQARIYTKGQRGSRHAGPSWITLRQARFVSATKGRAADYPTVLARLDESHVLSVGPGETRQLWLDVETYGLEAGIHELALELRPYQDLPFRTIPVTVTILDVALPQDTPASVFCFGLDPLEELGETGRSQEQINRTQAPWLQDMVGHGVNRFFQHTQYFRPRFTADDALAEPLDFSVHDAMLASKRRYFHHLIGGYSVAHYHLPKVPDEAFRRRFASLMKAWFSHLRTLGIQPRDFPLELFDEPSGDRLALCRVAYEVLKEVEPEAVAMAAVSLDTADSLRSTLDILDILVVNPDLVPASDKVLQESGKEIWTYVCDGTLESLEPYAYYRLLPWKTWSKGYSGFGFYWDMDNIEKSSPRDNMYSHWYFGASGPVPSRGWQAFWRGGRDWTTMHVLRAAIEAAKARGATEQAEQAQRVLSDAVENVLTHKDDLTRADTWRLRMLEAIHSLR
jgi:hypothetical protein